MQPLLIVYSATCSKVCPSDCQKRHLQAGLVSTVTASMLFLMLKESRFWADLCKSRASSYASAADCLSSTRCDVVCTESGFPSVEQRMHRSYNMVMCYALDSVRQHAIHLR